MWAQLCLGALAFADIRSGRKGTTFVARSDLDGDCDLPVLDADRVGADAQAGGGETFAGGDIELDAVPGAGDDFALADPLEAPAGGRRAGGGAVYRAGAERPELVGADVGQGVERAGDVEDADFGTSEFHHAVRAGWEVFDWSDDVL